MLRLPTAKCAVMVLGLALVVASSAGIVLSNGVSVAGFLLNLPLLPCIIRIRWHFNQLIQISSRTIVYNSPVFIDAQSWSKTCWWFLFHHFHHHHGAPSLDFELPISLEVCQWRESVVQKVWTKTDGLDVLSSSNFWTTPFVHLLFGGGHVRYRAIKKLYWVCSFPWWRRLELWRASGGTTEMDYAYYGQAETCGFRIRLNGRRQKGKEGKNKRWASIGRIYHTRYISCMATM
jgi:hypothetical protein